MFNLLVESTRQSRRRTPKYFLLTFLAYGSIMGAAVIGSIMFYSPALADTFDTIAMVAPQPPPAQGGPNKPQQGHKVPTQVVVSNILLNGPVDPKPHNLPDPNIVINTEGLPNPFGNGTGSGPGVDTGVIGGVPITSRNDSSAPVPETLPRAPERKTDVAKPDNKVYKVSDGVILGKAINIPRPVYPIIAKNIRLEGEVRVELVVDKNGHVLSAVAVSGPQMLRAAAVDAALRSTFKPTLLSGEPVIVQAIFTFNFKLN